MGLRQWRCWLIPRAITIVIASIQIASRTSFTASSNSTPACSRVPSSTLACDAVGRPASCLAVPASRSHTWWPSSDLAILAGAAGQCQRRRTRRLMCSRALPTRWTSTLCSCSPPHCGPLAGMRSWWSTAHADRRSSMSNVSYPPASRGGYAQTRGATGRARARMGIIRSTSAGVGVSPTNRRSSRAHSVANSMRSPRISMVTRWVSFSARHRLSCRAWPIRTQ